MSRHYADENVPLPIVTELRKLGHDVLTMVEAEQANQKIPDIEVLHFVTAEQRAILTLNRKHFIRLHQQQPDHHQGIIVCTFDADFIGQARPIHNAIHDLTLARQLVRVNRPRRGGL